MKRNIKEQAELDSRLNTDNKTTELKTNIKDMTISENNNLDKDNNNLVNTIKNPIINSIKWLKIQWVTKPVKVFKQFYTNNITPRINYLNNKIIIYQIVNRITHEMYIGCSFNGLNRLKTYYKAYKLLNDNTKLTTSKLWQNIKQYGIENFSMAIIQDLGDRDSNPITKQELETIERNYIILLYNQNPELLLNTRFVRPTNSTKSIDKTFNPRWLINPVIIYMNLLLDISKIKSDLKNDTVFVYQIVNIYTGQMYISSSLNGATAITRYLTKSFLQNIDIKHPIALEFKNWGFNCFSIAVLYILPPEKDIKKAKTAIKLIELAILAILKTKFPNKCLNVTNTNTVSNKNLYNNNNIIPYNPIYIDLSLIPNIIPEPIFICQTLKSNTKYVYIYNNLDANLNTFVGIYTILQCRNEFKISTTTIHKYAKIGKIYKNILISYTKLH